MYARRLYSIGKGIPAIKELKYIFETYVYFVRSVQFGRCRHGEHAPGVKFQPVYTCQVQNFTSVHVPDDVKLLTLAVFQPVVKNSCEAYGKRQIVLTPLFTSQDNIDRALLAASCQKMNITVRAHSCTNLVSVG